MLLIKQLASIFSSEDQVNHKPADAVSAVSHFAQLHCRPSAILICMKARFRYRIYPHPGQQVQLARTFGCARVVWNDALAYCLKVRDGKTPSGYDLKKIAVTAAKQDPKRSWLADVSSIVLNESVLDLATAFKNFFASVTGKRKGKKVKPPRFKKRRSAQSVRLTRGGFKLHAYSVYLAKVGKVPIVWSRPLPAEPSSVTVIKDASDRYFVSFVVEVPETKLIGGTDGVGVDLGIATFATLSTGEKVDAPKPLKRHLRRLKKAQRQMARKVKGSKRRERARRRVAKIHAHVADIRTDFLHKLSTRLINENQVVAIEDLAVANMAKNRRLSRAISDLGWRQFRTLLEYKGARYGRRVEVISRWEPTSQTCSCCGQKGGKLDLSIRKWTCLWCDASHDRDVNASRRILQVAGGQPETLNGCGELHKSGLPVAPVEALTHLDERQLVYLSR